MDLQAQQNHQHLMEMLRHMNESLNSKMNLILEKLGAEEAELMEHQTKWFQEIAFQAAKIYGEEHDITKKLKSEFKEKTGQEWHPPYPKVGTTLTIQEKKVTPVKPEKPVRWDAD